MRKVGLMFALVISSMYLSAQEEKKKTKADSVKEFQTDMAALMYPRLRQFSITHQENATGDIKSKLYNQDFFKGRFRSSRTIINFNLPVIDRPKNVLVTSLGVAHQFFYLDEIINYSSQNTATNTDTYVPMINLGFSYTHRDSIGNVPFFVTISANALFDPPMERHQLTYLGLVAVPVVRKPLTNLVVGLALNIDPSSPALVIPVISYFHKFRNANLDLMVDLPYRFALRKAIKKASISVSSEMAGSNSFFKFENPNPELPAKMTYSVLELKSGLTFEYQVTKKLIFTLSGGISSTLKSRILEQNAGPNDYIISNTIKPVPYGQVGLSMLPFWRPFKRK